MSNPAMDEAYNNMSHVPGSSELPAIWAARAQSYRDELDALGRLQCDIPYGDHPRHTYDLFRPEGTPRGLLVFIHGGYWKAFDAKAWSNLARGAVDAGWAVAMPSYVLCPEARIHEITTAIAKAVAAASAHVPEGPLRICGHSAGGHLSARMLCPGILPAPVLARIDRAIPMSPVADLRPLLETGMNDTLHLTPEEAEAESPVLYTPASHDCEITAWVGGGERPAFIDQAGWLAEAWGCARVITPEEHHFSVIEPLEDRNSPICKALLD